MALIVDNETISELIGAGTVMVDGESVQHVIVDGEAVWDAYSEPEPEEERVFIGEAKSPLYTHPDVWTALTSDSGGLKYTSSDYSPSAICFIDEDGNLTDGVYTIPAMANQGFMIMNNTFTATQNSSTTVGYIAYDPATGLFSGSTHVVDQYEQVLAITTAVNGELSFKVRASNGVESTTRVSTVLVTP